MKQYITERNVRVYTAPELFQALGMELPRGAQIILEHVPHSGLTIGYVQRIES